MVKVLRSFVRGPLEPYAPGFAEELLRQGYSRVGAEQHLCFIAHLDRWMSRHAVRVGELDAAVLDRYLAERRAAGYVQYNSVKALARCWGSSDRCTCCRLPPQRRRIRSRSCWAATAAACWSSVA